MTKRLSKLDWRLIYEALDMLLTDYPDGHPEQERLERLLEMASDRSEK